MAYRYHGRAEVNPDNPRAFAICQRCGFITNLYKLSWQWQWQAFTLYNTGLLVCNECYDKPSEFLKTLVLPPDPPPLYNVRPENYTVDEEGPTVDISAFVNLDIDTLTVLYLDLFDGPPSSGGTSVLETLTGSATRTNFFANMGLVSDQVSTSLSDILFVEFALESASVVWIGVYDAATSGTLLGSAQLGAPVTIVMGSGCQIPAGSLQVHLNLLAFNGQWDFSDPIQSGELLTY